MNTEPSASPAGVVIRSHGQIIAAIPTLLGFVPAESVVLLGTLQHRVVAAARIDLVDAAHVPHELRRPGPLDPADTVHVIVIAGSDPPTEPHHATAVPYADVAGMLIAGLSAAGFHIAHAAWTPALHVGQPWWCYREPGCHGLLPDPHATVVAAVATVAGQVTYASRQEMADTLCPDPAELLHVRHRLIAELLGSQPKDRQAAVLLVGAAMVRAGHGELPATDEEVSRLAAALADHGVRDACLSFCVDQRVSDRAQRLWTTLVRRTPAPYRAEPAVLLAITAYAQGDTVLAGLAAEAGLAAAPGHQMAAVLRAAIRIGLPAGDLRDAVIEALRSQ
jgi:Domain of unknown function (DUF4192)